MSEIWKKKSHIKAMSIA